MWKMSCFLSPVSAFFQHSENFFSSKAKKATRKNRVAFITAPQGFEPWNDGVRVRCLTAWRWGIVQYPYNQSCRYQQACPMDIVFNYVILSNPNMNCKGFLIIIVNQCYYSQPI